MGLGAGALQGSCGASWAQRAARDGTFTQGAGSPVNSPRSVRARSVTSCGGPQRAGVCDRNRPTAAAVNRQGGVCSLGAIALVAGPKRPASTRQTCSAWLVQQPMEHYLRSSRVVPDCRRAGDNLLDRKRPGFSAAPSVVACQAPTYFVAHCLSCCFPLHVHRPQAR